MMKYWHVASLGDFDTSSWNHTWWRLGIFLIQAVKGTIPFGNPSRWCIGCFGGLCTHIRGRLEDFGGRLKDFFNMDKPLEARCCAKGPYNPLIHGNGSRWCIGCFGGLWTHIRGRLEDFGCRLKEFFNMGRPLELDVVLKAPIIPSFMEMGHFFTAFSNIEGQ